jgi:hypothetical protein
MRTLNPKMTPLGDDLIAPHQRDEAPGVAEYHTEKVEIEWTPTSLSGYECVSRTTEI